MRCAKCNSENPADALFCMKCGVKVENRCTSCATVNPVDANFCRKCGAALGAGASVSASKTAAAKTPNAEVIRERPAAEGLEGERKTVTALFADIKGSTELEQDLDPEEARAIVDPALKLMIEAVRCYDGYIVQSTGDGIFALFGAPVAHEDHPQRALYAALRMQEELRRYGGTLQAEGRAPVEIRVGANTGEVVVRSILAGEAHNAIGHTTNLASRLQALARTGSVVISESTRKLVEGYFALKPLGTSRVKGIAEPVNVYEVTGLGPIRTRLQRSAGRGYTKFVGRQHEMDAMKHAAAQAAASHGQIVAAVAEPGVGKSRLFFEFKAIASAGWTVLETISLSHGKASAYLPVIDLLNGYFRILADDNALARREKVSGKILVLDRMLEDTLPYLFAMLGIVEDDDLLAQMDAKLRRQRTLEALKRILFRESLNRPLMVIFEDLHWIDEETQALLNLLVDSIGTSRVLLLVNYRPEYSHSWSSKTYYTQLRLDPLGRETADAMLQSLIGDASGLAPLKQLIIEKTQGNPLFMEEIVQALQEEGALVRNGAIHLTRPLDTLRIPTTVQAILASRIDRLPAPEKELLQTLAVIGKEFPLALAREVIREPDDELNRMLNDLQTAEFIYEQPAIQGVEYTFKHALTHEVAYNSLLVEKRKVLHERTGDAICGLFADRLEEYYGFLAHHYRRSHNSAKAVDYLLLAAEQATRRSANTEALDCLKAAEDMLPQLSDQTARVQKDLSIQITKAAVVTTTTGFSAPKKERALARARELCSGTGDSRELFAILFQLGELYMGRSRPAQARELAQECLRLAEREQDRDLLRGANHLLGETSCWLGDFTLAQERLGAAVQLHETANEHAIARVCGPGLWVVSGGLLACWAEYPLGQFDRAHSRVKEMVRRARSRSNLYDRAFTLVFAGLLHVFRGEPEVAGAVADEVCSLSREHGFREMEAWGRWTKGWSLFEQGETDKGLREMNQANSSCDEIGGTPAKTLRVGMTAEFYERVGQRREASGALAEARALMERGGERFFEAEICRIEGEMSLRDERSASDAERSFLKAIEIARRQSAKWWELRATISLTRLLRDTGHCDQARAMLAEIYGWFTEGFDTTDLKEAKALLDELGA